MMRVPKITFLVVALKQRSLRQYLFEQPHQFSQKLLISNIDRVRLSKRRLKAGQQPSNSKLVVRHRPLNKQEHKMQRYRERNLEPPGFIYFQNFFLCHVLSLPNVTKKYCYSLAVIRKSRLIYCVYCTPSLK